MAEILLSAAITVLFDRLASRELLNFARKEGIHSKLSKWRNTLFKIQAVLTDAQDKQITNPAVKAWLDDLQDLAYDLDDLLDEFYTETLRRKVMERPQASTSKVLKFISTCATNFTPRALLFDGNMASKIDNISSRLQEISTEKNDLDLKENVGGINSNKSTSKRLPSTSLVDQPRVYGRRREKEAILELLSSGDDEVSVIPIVGMGGLGKTTLAQMVYNDDKLKSMGFHLKAWACVSDDFDVFGITRSIIELLTSQPCNLKDLNALQVKLQRKLSGHKFLIVLDDIWNKKYEDWDVLRRPFLGGAPGSKIIITTRNRSVASMMSTIPAYPLKELESEECLKLFAQHALERINFDQHQNLKEVGEEIVRKCKGLPLAIKTLGGLLRSKQQRPSEWEDVLNSKIWEISEEESGILLALQLSYHHLPSHLKQCFAYCSIFPQDYKFDEEELVLLWMAVGLLPPSKGTKKSVEDFGREYFDDLLSRSFFQQSSSDKSRFLMHDLINDLAQHTAGEMCFRLDDKSNGHKQHNQLSERGRHLSYTRHEAYQKFKDFNKVPHLRTFLPLPIRYEFMVYHLSNKVLVDLLPKLQCLRVLSLSGYSICVLPNSIGELKHLRYLNLSHTSIKWLPDSVCTLYNLQTLSLRGCKSLCKLPTSIGDLLNLHHLDNAETDQLQEMPSGIGKVRNLQTLPKIVLRKNNGLRLKELSDLRLLRGRLSVVGLQNVVDIHDAKEVDLRRKHGLDELGLVWGKEFDDSRDEKVEMDVLDMLQPHVNLKRLKIEFYGGMKFPTWIGDRSFSKVVEVSLTGCMKCTSLPPLGQLPMLKHLCIDGISKVRSVGVEFYGDGCSLEFGFPSLETLSFKDMPEWEEWSHFNGGGEAGGQFRRLSEFTISKCPNLVSLPLLQLPSLRKIKLEECRGAVLKSFADLTSLITLEIDGVTELSCLHTEFMQFSTALEVLNFYECNDLVTVWQNGVATPKENLVRLKELTVLKCPQLVSLEEEEQGLPCNLEVLELSECSNLEKVPIGLNSVTSLKRLTITECPKLVLLGDEEQGLPCNVEYLEISDCSNLEKLPNGLNSLTSLKELTITRCPKLVSLGEEKQGLPCNLEDLGLYDCSNLEKLPNGLNSLASLKNLTIMECPKVVSLGEEEQGLPCNLEVLTLDDCSNLEKLPNGMNSLTSLKKFAVRECPKLVSFQETLAEKAGAEISGLDDNSNSNSWLTSLKYLWIDNNQNIIMLFVHNFASLVDLYIYNCGEVESFPEGGLPTPNLRRLWIWNCKRLRCLPDRIQSLASLTDLHIRDCKSLESFPNAEFPNNLTRLRIIRCEKLKPLSEWGLHRLTSLRAFGIDGPEMVCFSDNDDQCLLPPTLTGLYIGGFPNLESISKGLRNLTSLQKIYIRDCPKLASLPLPKDELLPMLWSLNIRGDCPVVKGRCLKDKGDYWPHIKHIPQVLLDGRSIYEVED